MSPTDSQLAPGKLWQVKSDDMRILIIEDDEKLARLMGRVLEKEHHAVELAHDGDMGLEFALQGAYDAAIVDWMLPRRDGPSIVRAIRAARIRIPVLMLTARTQVEDRVTGLDSGADDYLVKPFSFDELLARVRAMGRRTAADAVGDELRCGEIVMDLRAHAARRGLRPLELTATEWSLLEYLMRHRGQALSRQQILDSVWSYERDVQPKMVDIYVSYLRRAINADGEHDPIEAVRGIGYKFEI